MFPRKVGKRLQNYKGLHPRRRCADPVSPLPWRSAHKVRVLRAWLVAYWQEILTNVTRRPTFELGRSLHILRTGTVARGSVSVCSEALSEPQRAIGHREAPTLF
jgi:hypothetical protein